MGDGSLVIPLCLSSSKSIRRDYPQEDLTESIVRCILGLTTEERDEVAEVQDDREELPYRPRW